MKKYRLFIYDLAWCKTLLIFDHDIKFSDIKEDEFLKRLTKNDFIGVYELDDNFLKIFDTKEIKNKTYYFRHLYDKKCVDFQSLDDELF